MRSELSIRDNSMSMTLPSDKYAGHQPRASSCPDATSSIATILSNRPEMGSDISRPT